MDGAGAGGVGAACRARVHGVDVAARTKGVQSGGRGRRLGLEPREQEVSEERWPVVCGSAFRSTAVV